MDAAAPGDAPRRPHRVVAVVTAVTVTLALAVAVPVVLADRGAHATDDLRGDLQRVADAQTSWKADHGAFSTSLDDLGVRAARADVAIVSAGAHTFCAGAYDGGTGTALFYSPGGGFSESSCS